MVRWCHPPEHEQIQGVSVNYLNGVMPRAGKESDGVFFVFHDSVKNIGVIIARVGASPTHCSLEATVIVILSRDSQFWKTRDSDRSGVSS